MPRAFSLRRAAGKASRSIPRGRQRACPTSFSDRAIIIGATHCLCEQHGLLPCLCSDDDGRKRARRQSPAMLLSNSSNAFWNRSRTRRATKDSQRNNSTASKESSTKVPHPRSLQTIRKSIVRRLTQRQTKKMPTITARSVRRHLTPVTSFKRGPSTTHRSMRNDKHVTASLDRSLLTVASSNGGDSRSFSPGGSCYNSDEGALKASTPLFNNDYQNVNATDTMSRTIQDAVRSKTSSLVVPSKARSNTLTSTGSTQRKPTASKRIRRRRAYSIPYQRSMDDGA